MNLNDFRVNYADYNNILEPRIYIWEEEKTGRIIARIFNNGEKANNCRLNYSRITRQQVNWCSGVFPVDFDRDFIKNWYPTVEFQDELVDDGRKRKIKSKKIPKIMIGAKIPIDLKEQIDKYSFGTKKSISQIIIEALKKYLEGKESIVEQISELDKQMKELQKLLQQENNE